MTNEIQQNYTKTQEMKVDSVIAKIVDIFARYCIKDKLTPNVSFNELGLDSLDMVDISHEFEKKFNIKITDETYRSTDTFVVVVRDLARKMLATKQLTQAEFDLLLSKFHIMEIPKTLQQEYDNAVKIYEKALADKRALEERISQYRKGFIM